MPKPSDIPHTVDLHGLSVQQGYNKTLMLLKVAKMNAKKSCRIITGRSGTMNKEFQRWMENPDFKPYIDKAWQDYHKGSWVVWVKQ